MGGLRMGELLLIFLVVLVLFGGTKLPQLGSSLGQAIRNFKRGFNGADEPEESAAPRKGQAVMSSGQVAHPDGEHARSGKVES